jgi:hypothetical protein
MPSITPSLWFDHNMEEAVTFYSSVFPNSRIEELNRATEAGPGEPAPVRTAPRIPSAVKLRWQSSAKTTPVPVERWPLSTM